MSMQALYELAGCDRAWAAQRAAMTIAIVEQHQQGRLSTEEARELMQDLVRMDQLDQEADDMAVKTALVTAVWAVAEVI